MGTCNQENDQPDAERERLGNWQQAQQILEELSSLSYRAGELDEYLQNIAIGVSQLIGLDWSVVTVCQDGTETVKASSLDLGTGEHIYTLHGLLTETVVRTGQSLAVEDAKTHPEYGKPPEGYRSYLGVPLRTPQNEIIGTVCSFSKQPRPFSVEEVRTAELFAERAATAIDNYRLYQNLQRFNERLEDEVAKRTAELEAAQAQLIEQERLAAVGQFAAMIIHEIRNPVTTIHMGLNYFKRTHLAEPDQERAALALDEVIRLENLLNEILLYAKPNVLQTTPLDINHFISSLLPTLKEMPEALDRTIEFIPVQPAVVLHVDKNKMKQVMINLVRNACEAISPGETVTCKASLVPAPNPPQPDLPEPDRLCLSIHNSGEPIPPEILTKLTQPFCSTKPDGTGLGLAIVKRIVEAHGGMLAIESSEADGTVVTITFPIVAIHDRTTNVV
jgi:signal transduction histidine kinase